MSRHLHGSCACGRNQYIVEIPPASTEVAQVFFENGSASRRHQAAPVTAWLRVPLDWYHSTTYALYPDESHRSIRRTFTTPGSSHTRRQFCGYCGTPLSTWSAETRHDADFIQLTLASLVDDSLARLEDLGLVPSETEDESEKGELEGETQTQLVAVPPSGHNMRNRGMPYFESMIENSRLGRIKRRRGGHTSRDGSVTVEWEVVEYTEGDDEPAQEAIGEKRKLARVEGSEDVHMKSA
ncbi:hypothetical protein BJ546DRAFT_998775 [Cryomyces antarcticus]